MAGVAAQTSGKPFRLGLRNSLAFGSIMIGATMQSVDTTIANVALPHMQGTLAATIDQIAWVLTSYIVATAIGTPLIGWLASRYGQKLVLQLSLIGFTMASVACGLAAGLEDMVVYRTLQGFSSAALLPIAQTVALRLHPKEYFPRAMAIMGIGMMLGPILGPTIGGYIVEISDWRWIFFINLPLGIVSLIGVQLFLDEHKSDTDSNFDFFGFFMLIIGIGALQLLLDRGETKNWFDSMEIVAYAVLAPLALYLFVVQTVTARRPFIDRGLFLDRNFMTACILFILTSGNMLVTIALQPTMLANVMNYPAFDIGILLAPRGFGMMIGMILATRLMKFLNVRNIVILGSALMALGTWDMTQFSITIAEWDIARTGFVQGVGIGLVFVQLNAFAFYTLPEHLHIQGATMFNLARAVGTSIVLSIAISMLAAQNQLNHAEVAAHISHFNEPWLLSLLPPGWEDLSDPLALRMLNLEVTRQGMMVSYINMFKLLMYSSLAGILLMFFIKVPKYGKSAAQGTPVEV